MHTYEDVLFMILKEEKVLTYYNNHPYVRSLSY